MLTRAIVDMTQTNRQSAIRLREIGGQLEHASVVDDLRTLRVRLSECLDRLQKEIRDQEKTAEQAASRLQAGLESTQAKLRAAQPAAERDPVTGLPPFFYPSQ